MPPLWKISFFMNSACKSLPWKILEKDMNLSLYTLLYRKYEQENKAMAVLEQMSPNMKQLEHGCISNLPAKRLETAALLLPNPSACPRSWSLLLFWHLREPKESSESCTTGKEAPEPSQRSCKVPCSGLNLSCAFAAPRLELLPLFLLPCPCKVWALLP